nr:ribonuclease H-like domain-containing protein [Tanacetum cinerariifolium]
IKREFSNAKTLQQNGVAERRNKTLIEAARTMLADAKLPVTFWAEAVNIACYVQIRVLVNKSQNKTPYELFNGRTPAIGFLKPFACHVMILNTLDNLGKFQAQEEEIVKLKDGVQVLEDREAAERISNDLEEVAMVLTSMDAATVLARGIDVPTSSGSIPTTGPPATIISTGSEVGPTASPIVSKRKGKEFMVESDTPKKKKLQEQIDAQVARELEEQQEKENKRMNEQIARDAEVARIHAEEELQGMIDS